MLKRESESDFLAKYAHELTQNFYTANGVSLVTLQKYKQCTVAGSNMQIRWANIQWDATVQ